MVQLWELLWLAGISSVFGVSGFCLALQNVDLLQALESCL